MQFEETTKYQINTSSFEFSLLSPNAVLSKVGLVKTLLFVAASSALSKQPDNGADLRNL